MDFLNHKGFLLLELSVRIKPNLSLLLNIMNVFSINVSYYCNYTFQTTNSMKVKTMAMF